MSENTFSIGFIVRKVKASPKEADIFAKVTLNGGKPKEISLHERIPFNKWNQAKEMVMGSTQGVTELNEHIDEVRANLRRINREFKEQMKPYTAQDIKDAYLGKFKQQHPEYTLLKLVAKHADEWKRKLSEDYFKNYVTTATYLTNFLADRKKQLKCGEADIHVTEITPGFASDFEHYIPGHPLKSHDPCNANGTAKHIERLKKMVTWAKEIGWLIYDPLENYVPYRTKFTRKKLKFHVVMAMEKRYLQNPELRFVRDLFIFSCYTGMGYAEVMNLSIHDFEVSANGKFYCGIYRTKTGEPCAVPLLDAAVKYIKKYIDHPESVQRGKIFPYLTNQQVNRALKILQEIFSIPFDLTFHVARHTFSSVIALKNGVPLNVVQIILGHKQIKTTEIYATPDEEMIEENIQLLEIRIEERKKLPSPQEYLDRRPLTDIAHVVVQPTG